MAIDTVEDMHVLLDGHSARQGLDVDDDQRHGVDAARDVHRRGRGAGHCPRDKLSGTIQNDILKEYIARGTYIYPPEPSLALIAEVFRFCAAEVPNWNPISISGYHIREAGATAVQELAFTFANAIEYVDARHRRGADRRYVRAATVVLLCRAQRRVRGSREVSRRATDLCAHHARAVRRERREQPAALSHADGRRDAAGAAAAEQRRSRRRCRRLSAVLGGTQSLHTNGYDEALVAADGRGGDARAAHAADHRARVGRGAHGRSARRELLRRALTDELERRATELLAKVDELGGAAKAIAASFFQEEIARSAYEFQLRVESGETVIVGVNKFADDSPPPVIPTPDYSALERGQVERVRAVRARRDAQRVDAPRSRRCASAARGLRSARGRRRVARAADGARSSTPSARARRSARSPIRFA